MKIDFVSDVVCPWCAIGLWALDKAVSNSGVMVSIHVQPFELNPDLAREGEGITEHLVRKYGGSPEQFARSSEMIRQRGAELGFTFDLQKRTHIYNTFDAHRLLAWAGDRGLELKRALLTAYHSEGRNVSDHAVLNAIAESIGLSGASAMLASDAYGSDVRQRERLYIERGINGVPAVIINDQYLISGGQPVEVFENALRELA